ncbi:nuclear transport factor 2 family protein [Caulobacter segnis]
MSNPTNAGPDGAGLLHANLERVFGERDGARRLSAIQTLYAEDATLFEPHAVATGPEAINQAVEALLASLPPSFAFVAVGPAAAHHGVGRLRWACGPADGPAAVTGTDVARFADGRIQTLHVFLDPAGA